MNLRQIYWPIVSLFLSVGCGQEVKSISLDPMNISFTKTTQSTELKAKAEDIHGAEVPGVAISFRSEDSSIATVDSAGIVKPAGNGNVVIVASAKDIQGEAFVKVCLPKELICDPTDKLELKVGVAGPIKCHVTNCRNEKIPTRIEIAALDSSLVLKEGDNVFIGLKEGDGEIDVKAMGLSQKIAVHVAEQAYLPGMGPSSGGGGGGGGGKGRSKEESDPYGGGGRYDHIIKNMKFND